jgi:hypothetical protein
MSLPVRFSVAGDSPERLAALDARLDPGVLTRAMIAGPVTAHLQSRAKDRFFREGDKASGAWARLKSSTHEIRINTGFVPDHPINERTGELREWAAESAGGGALSAGRGARFVYPAVIPKALAEKVITAQRGKAEKPRTVARPILALDETDAAVLTTMVGEFITNG